MNLTRGRGAVNLADLIMEKIREGEGAPATAAAGGLKPKVVQVYNSVGSFLKKYRSGKLPKPFKVIPALSNWEEVRGLYLVLDPHQIILFPCTFRFYT
jgi:hypothetical protein